MVAKSSASRHGALFNASGNMMNPHYWQQATAELAAADPVMAQLSARFAGQGLVSRGDPFATLARSIVGQQISVKAADSVWARFVAAVGEVSPERVALAGVDGLTGCGLSARKIEYLSDLAGHFLSGRLDPLRWPALPDEEVIAELIDVRGIGRWTAEMFLIFNLLRPDVFPLDDIGLQKAVFRHYFAEEKQPRRVLVDFGERWRPWRSVATWLLWRSLDPVPVEY
jgi:DNA-3-methyladenine glycosylase II